MSAAGCCRRKRRKCAGEMVCEVVALMSLRRCCKGWLARMSIWVVVRGLVRSSLWVAGVVAPQAWWGKAAVVVDIVDVVDILIWWSRRKTW
jgi:hypothetical protein